MQVLFETALTNSICSLMFYWVYVYEDVLIHPNPWTAYVDPTINIFSVLNLFVDLVMNDMKFQDGVWKYVLLPYVGFLAGTMIYQSTNDISYVFVTDWRYTTSILYALFNGGT
eukprot:CAMPEP_0202963180 /NCGR_PEP_ID=MMETSP1396-20130829/7170_1 /ASSEMBLY_ACC=CAM_ASM_000872 /TAXON_ID= /ORGANISM="Pseudokeronopsis sp., Strain Brazil" /LENGTH=112 /DNA_ID=CAMNT_0049684179 /DNA_START=111 /DNA_END=445 /DNA_ORIENTATION=-